MERLLLGHVRAGEAEARVASEDAVVVGFVAMGRARGEDAPAPEEVYGIHVRSRVHGRGTGRGLLDRALERVRAAGHAAAYLWVLDDNRGARAFYERLGWEADGGARAFTFADGLALGEVRYLTSLDWPDEEKGGLRSTPAFR